MLTTPPIELTLTPTDVVARTVGGEATPGENGVCSILRGGCGNWLPMIGYTVAVQWDLSIPNTEEVRNLFNNGSILDIVLVISYAGRLPDWPA